MFNGKKIVVVMPAYNAEKTLKKTYEEIPFDIVDDVILVNDASKDSTDEEARKIGIKHIINHAENKGYGGNQKTCYKKALEINADVIIMLHPDYQYTPLLIHAMASIIATGLYPVVFGSRILGKGALRGGMPLYKYIFNRFLTLTQNILMNEKLSEYHTGYRAFHRDVLLKVNYENNSNDFVFDNEMVAQIFAAGYNIAEVTCPTKYFEDASSISFQRSIKYGMGVLNVSFGYFLKRLRIYTPAIYKPAHSQK
ncbi:MAG: glycosyltransferase family 2 protein [Chitinophagaceae bacterium]|nr:glycosyltransferase family 2 protein [Chitinophagaceae bacterium]